MLLETLRTYQKTILTLSQEHGARNIRVFGSAARGEEHPDSDVDFLVGFPPGYDLFTRCLSLSESLSQLLSHSVQVNCPSNCRRAQT
ncbi:MAG: nucleotidyltransferase family protein [Cyanobacteriota bacterium]